MERCGVRRWKLMSLAGILLGVLFGGVFGGEAATATLTVHPAPDVKPGETLTFSVQVAYSDPAPVISVILGGTMWSTELQTVQFSGVGQPATVQFSKAYTVPSDAKAGTALCFLVVSGGGNVEMKQPISAKNCVMIKDPITFKPVKKVDPAKFLLVPDLIVTDARIDPSNGEVVQVKVVNQGLGDAGASILCVQVRLWSGGGSKQLANRQAKVPPLKAGEELWLSVDTGVMGPVFYEFTADCKNAVKEANESNNTGILDRTIK